jgi:hypothetical protein
MTLAYRATRRLTGLSNPLLKIVRAEPIHARSVTGVPGPGASDGDFAEPGCLPYRSFTVWPRTSAASSRRSAKPRSAMPSSDRKPLFVRHN